MNGAVISHILSTNPGTKKWFCGFSSPDIPLPDIEKYPSLIILNTDKANGPGEHWCVVIIFNKNYCEFFDSYGRPPCKYNLEEPILKHVNQITYNPKRVQGNAPTCGHHCLFFALHRASGKTLSEIMYNLYTECLKINDNIVYSFVQNSYGKIYASFNYPVYIVFLSPGKEPANKKFIYFFSFFLTALVLSTIADDARKK